MNQLYIYIYPHISSFLYLPPSHPPYPTPLGGHRALSWSPCAMRLQSYSGSSSYSTKGQPVSTGPVLVWGPHGTRPSPLVSRPFRHWRKFSCSPLSFSFLFCPSVLKNDIWLSVLQCVVPVLWSFLLLSCLLWIKHFYCFSSPTVSCPILACWLYIFVILVFDYNMHPCYIKV